mmetsp:Transcript_156/g.395  ORF Transcript_156/g.395 Transcript_156/m.395 type:complete len:321 (-) Transcript_156:882-1844(-)
MCRVTGSVASVISSPRLLHRLALRSRMRSRALPCSSSPDGPQPPGPQPRGPHAPVPAGDGEPDPAQHGSYRCAWSTSDSPPRLQRECSTLGRSPSGAQRMPAAASAAAGTPHALPRCAPGAHGSQSGSSLPRNMRWLSTGWRSGQQHEDVPVVRMLLPSVVTVCISGTVEQQSSDTIADDAAAAGPGTLPRGDAPGVRFFALALGSATIRAPSGPPRLPPLWGAIAADADRIVLGSRSRLCRIDANCASRAASFLRSTRSSASLISSCRCIIAIASPLPPAASAVAAPHMRSLCGRSPVAASSCVTRSCSTTMVRSRCSQ